MRLRDEPDYNLSPEAWDLIENCLSRSDAPGTIGADFLDSLFQELLDAGFVTLHPDTLDSEFGETKVYLYTDLAKALRLQYYGRSTRGAVMKIRMQAQA